MDKPGPVIGLSLKSRGISAVVTYRFGPFALRDNESLWMDDTLLPLSPLQLRLLCHLCRHPQQVLDKEDIVQAVWGHTKVSDVSLARAIHGLRNRMVVGGKPHELIRNIYGRGYILTMAVSVSASEISPADLPRSAVVEHDHPEQAAQGSGQSMTMVKGLRAAGPAAERRRARRPSAVVA